MVLWLGLTAGMRVTEIAQIEVQDVLLPSGALRDEVSLRAAIRKECRQRCIYLSHAKTFETLERYLDYRIARRLRTTGDPARYRGMEPESKLILTHKGYKFHLNTKKPVTWAGEQVDYPACDSLQSHVTKLYRDAGIGGRLSHSGRHTMALRLIQQGAGVETVQLLLGHAELDQCATVPWSIVEEARGDVRRSALTWSATTQHKECSKHPLVSLQILE